MKEGSPAAERPSHDASLASEGSGTISASRRASGGWARTLSARPRATTCLQCGPYLSHAGQSQDDFRAPSPSTESSQWYVSPLLPRTSPRRPFPSAVQPSTLPSSAYSRPFLKVVGCTSALSAVRSASTDGSGAFCGSGVGRTAKLQG